jgi:hypothetical protein
MNIRIIGAGWYGCHIAATLKRQGHRVELHESGADIFSGASGANPARLHLGFHYPRSKLTRQACQEHFAAFMLAYGSMTRHIPVNLYAIAAEDSYLDFGTYLKVMQGDAEFIAVQDPAEFGLANVEGAVQTAERHIVIDAAKAHFRALLADDIRLNVPPGAITTAPFDWTIDCTFCANDEQAIDRFEPCVTALLEGPTDKAVTVMDGPFPSLYPWNESQGLNSLTSARFTPFTKTCKTYAEARATLDALSEYEIHDRCHAMFKQLCRYWPAAGDLYRFAGYRTAIRAMPRSGADARLVDILRVGPRRLRVRAGKIDAIVHAGRTISLMIEEATESCVKAC